MNVREKPASYSFSHLGGTNLYFVSPCFGRLYCFDDGSENMHLIAQALEYSTLKAYDTSTYSDEFFFAKFLSTRIFECNRRDESNRTVDA